MKMKGSEKPQLSLPRSKRSQKIEFAQQDESWRVLMRSMGMKVTTQRILMLQALHEGRAHVTAQEVFEQVQKKDSSIGFATVYRFLRTLTELSFAVEVKIGGMPARYELQSGRHHDHLTCTTCGMICEFENAQIEALQLSVARKLGFELTSHVLELYGICPDCQRRRSADLAPSK